MNMIMIKSKIISKQLPVLIIMFWSTGSIVTVEWIVNIQQTCNARIFLASWGFTRFHWYSKPNYMVMLFCRGTATFSMWYAKHKFIEPHTLKHKTHDTNNNNNHNNNEQQSNTFPKMCINRYNLKTITWSNAQVFHFIFTLTLPHFLPLHHSKII